MPQNMHDVPTQYMSVTPASDVLLDDVQLVSGCSVFSHCGNDGGGLGGGSGGGGLGGGAGGGLGGGGLGGIWHDWPEIRSAALRPSAGDTVGFLAALQ